MKSRFSSPVVVIACLSIWASLALAQGPRNAIPSTARLSVSPAAEQTPAMMDAYDATHPVTGNKTNPFLPTVDMGTYQQMKHAAGLAPQAARPAAPQLNAPENYAATLVSFKGISECDAGSGCWTPPDVAGAIGKSQFVAASNDAIEIFSRTGTLLRSNSLNGFFGYSAASMFDPRVLYDEEYQRWIVTADAFPVSSTSQIFGFAISKTSSATGGWWIYFIDVNFMGGANSFYDFPMVGMTQDSVLFTANVFLNCTPNCSGFQGSSLFAVAKARLYNGQGFGVPLYLGLDATLEPAHQLQSDQNDYAWLAAAPPGSSSIQMYALGAPSNPSSQSLSGPYAVTGVNTYGVPPVALQPSACGGTTTLDTSDNRFQNTGTQNGDTYYQVHDTNDFGYATPRYYVITGLLSFAPAVSTQTDFFSSGSSYDFNPSIAADNTGRIALNWSATDPAGNGAPTGNPAIWYRSTKTNAASLTYQSASCYNFGAGGGTSRWGDYSQITPDPGAGLVSNVNNVGFFWMDNETTPTSNTWSTQIIKHPY